jgi:hypothetical protein
MKLRFYTQQALLLEWSTMPDRERVGLLDLGELDLGELDLDHDTETNRVFSSPGGTQDLSPAL